MQLLRTRPRPRRLIAFAVGATVAAGLFVAPQTVLAAPTPPPNPTDGQLNGAANQKSALASRVGELSGQLADAQQRLTQFENAAALAEQKVAFAVTEYRQAVQQANAASKQKTIADGKVVDAQRRFAQYMQATYMDGRPDGLTGSLLTADDPNALLQQSSYEQYEASHNAGVIGEMQKLTVARSNAEARAKNLRAKADEAKKKSIEAQQAAADAVDNQKREQGAIEATMATTQTELDSASARLATLNGQRTQYNDYVAEQKRLAEIRRQKRLAEQRRLAAIERQKQEAAARQRERERERNQNNNNNSGGGNGGGGGGGGGSTYNPPPQNNPPAPGNGGWTAAKAQRAVNRAKSTLGTPYAWAGGGAGGPSYGACVPSAGAPYDCNIRGYDCSGLVMYAWGKGWDHYAATQYSQAGSFHPSRYNLKKGDLVFFSTNGTVGGIHHVALSLGGDRIIEAPYSGGYVQYNNLSSYGDYYGATRPLT